LYAIGVFNDAIQGMPTTEERLGPTLLQEITSMSGGLVFMADKDQHNLDDIADKIGRALRDQFVISYKPSQKRIHDGKYHKLKVKMRLSRGMPPLIPYARYGYTGKP
jgi:Ca-activated chloride channel homolog